jgi:hypothetical protein
MNGVVSVEAFDTEASKSRHDDRLSLYHKKWTNE